MRIVSHRGHWRRPQEQNTPEAIARSFRLGFGVEFDVRDCAGVPVIAHDLPARDAVPAETVFAMRAAEGPGLPLAINIKADGLQGVLADTILRAGPEAFVFDMSIPDTLAWLRTGVPVFVRHSDVEPDPVLYDRAAGVWLDAFRSDWWGRPELSRHLEAGKRLCIVSPELHGRAHLPVWERLAETGLVAETRLMLCTDFPQQAQEFFHG